MATAPTEIRVENSRIRQLIFGIIWLAAAGGICALIAILWIKFANDEELTARLRIAMNVVFGFFAGVCAVNGVLRLIKLRYNYIFLADDKGIYDYYSLIPLGFVGWENIERVHYTSCDLENDTLFPAVKIKINSKALKGKKNIFQRWQLIVQFSGKSYSFIAAKPKAKEVYAGLKPLYDNYKNGGNAAD